MRSDAVDLHDEASAEYDAAFDWYVERSPDAAVKFDAEVNRALSQIVQAPQRWAAGHRAECPAQEPAVLCGRIRMPEPSATRPPKTATDGAASS